jgi:hypothetical protein
MSGTSTTVYSFSSQTTSRIGLGQAAVMAAASFIFGASPVLAQSPASQAKTQVPAARDATTESSLQREMQKSKRMADYKGAFEAAPQVKPDLTPSLYKKSIILFDGDNHTVVPMGAVLALPASYRSRIIDKPEGTFQFWSVFLEKNKNWLGAWEVPMAMARGDAEMSKSVMKQIANDTRVLVAVYKGGPITVLEPVPDKTTKTAGTKE